jgi:hypothetical protein
MGLLDGAAGGRTCQAACQRARCIRCAPRLTLPPALPTCPPPRYIKTAAYGHFGREEEDVFTWEKVIKL